MIAGDTSIDIADKLANRRAVIVPTTENRLLIEVPKVSDDPPDIAGWNSSDKKSTWTQIASTTTSIDDVPTFHGVRRLIHDGKADLWVYQERSGKWIEDSSPKDVLQSHGFSKSDAEIQMGLLKLAPWDVVKIPFQPEYPGNRVWNRNAPQLVYKPQPHDGDAHPTWDLHLNHIGESLTKPIQMLPELAGLRESGILTGRDYLMAYFANIIRRPLFRLPYLFVAGPQGNGKTLVTKSFSLLVTSGVVDAYRALKGEFNGSLTDAVLAVVDDKSLDASVTDKIKQYVTDDKIAIRKMYKEEKEKANYTHFVHLANQLTALVIPAGDTRVTLIRVDRFKGKEIPMHTMMERLRNEAAAFTYTLLTMHLPPIQERLALPVVDTDERQELIALNAAPLHLFVNKWCDCNGGYIRQSEFNEHAMKLYDRKNSYYADFSNVSTEIGFSKGTRTIDEATVKVVNGISWKPSATALIEGGKPLC